MFDIDANSRLPIYEQLKRAVIRQIMLGVYTTDDQLPTVRAVASSLGINPNTVQKAYRELERDGFIYSISGKGSYVAVITEVEDVLRRRLRDSFRQNVRYGRAVGLSDEEIRRELEALLEEEAEDD